MRRGRHAVARVAIAVLVAIAVTLAGVGGYVILGGGSAYFAGSTASASTSLVTSICLNSSDTTAIPDTISGPPSPAISNPNYALLFAQFSEMEVSDMLNQTTTNATGFQGTVTTLSSYQVVGSSGPGYGPGEVYDVDVGSVRATNNQAANNETLDAQVSGSGTVDWLVVAGQNTTGQEAQGLLTSTMAPFDIELEEGGTTSTFVSSPALRAINMTTETVGPTTLNVTNYEPAGPVGPTPSVDECGITTTITALSLQMGRVPGSSFVLVTYENLQMSIQSSSGTASGQVVLRLLSVS